MIPRLPETRTHMVAGRTGRSWKGGEQGVFPAGPSEDGFYFCIWLKIDKLIAEPIVRKLAMH